MKIKEIRNLTSLTQEQFSKQYNIPLPTLKHWERGDRECPNYVLELLEFKVKEDLSMIKIEKSKEDEFMQCSSCLCSNENKEIYKIQIGKSERQTTTIKLCYECLCDLIGKSAIETNK